MCMCITAIAILSTQSPGPLMASALPLPATIKRSRSGTLSMADTPSPIQATQAQCARWPGPLMARALPLPHGIRPCGCGKHASLLFQFLQRIEKRTDPSYLSPFLQQPEDLTYEENR